MTENSDKNVILTVDGNGSSAPVQYEVNTVTENIYANTENLNDGSNDTGVNADENIPERPDERLLLAVTYLEDAIDGRTLPYKTDPLSIDQYRIYNSSIRQWGTVFFMWWNLALAIFEYPAVPGAELPYWATMIMECMCLGVFMFRFWRLSRFVPRSALIHDPKNIVIMLTVVITFVDMIVYIGMINSSSSDDAIRVSRILRPLFLVNMNESRQIRRAFRNIRNTIPDILSVLILFFLSIALFSLMAFKLFELRGLYYRTGLPYFVNYWDSYWDLYVLVTTANSPDAMMPAYDYSGWFAIFFITYIIVNTYIFMNLILAVIYNSFKNHLQKEIGIAVQNKQKMSNKAFELLVENSSHDQPCVTFERWRALLCALSSPIGEERIVLLWHVLCDNETKDGITRASFARAADALNCRLVVDGTGNNVFLNKMPRCYNSTISRYIITGVNHTFFVYAFDLLILANAVCIALDYEQTEWFFLPVFMIEIALRMYAVGPKEYFSRDRLWNWFDFIIISAAFIATIVEASLDELDDFPREALDILLVLRCLRLVKIVGNIETFRVVVTTIVNITPSLLTYGGVLLMVYYGFAVVGMWSFANKLHYNSGDPQDCLNDKLIGSEFERMGYCQINFNDILHSFVTLFVLMVVNQWHVITQGYVLITGKAARLFFISFHLTVVILILNIIVAFVLEAFILEYTVRNNELEDRIDEKITELRAQAENEEISTATTSDSDPVALDIVSGDENCTASNRIKRPTYRYRSNRGHKNIEVLLHRMFYTTQTPPNVEGNNEETNGNQTIPDMTQSSSAI